MDDDRNLTNSNHICKPQASPRMTEHWQRHHKVQRPRRTIVIKHGDQDDGTWTDIPRCVEHEPGVEEQIPGLCPGISGYCATGFLNGRCRCVAKSSQKKYQVAEICPNSGLTAQLGGILIPFARLMELGRPTLLVRYWTCQVLHMSGIALFWYPPHIEKNKAQMEVLIVGRQTRSTRRLRRLPWPCWRTEKQVSIMIAINHPWVDAAPWCKEVDEMDWDIYVRGKVQSTSDGANMHPRWY